MFFLGAGQHYLTGCADRTFLAYTMKEELNSELLTPMSLRKRAGLTQRQVAQALDIRSQTVGSWEKGVIPHLPPSKLKKMMEVYNCTLDELIEAFETSATIN